MCCMSFLFLYVVCCLLLGLLNLLSCTSMGWLEEISFSDKPTIAINCETCHVCCVFYKCNNEFNMTCTDKSTTVSTVKYSQSNLCFIRKDIRFKFN
jgi:hypothetical protein